MVLISSSLIMFGGFDGEFFDDLNVLDLKRDIKALQESPSTKDSDLLSLVNSPTEFNMILRIVQESNQFAFMDIKACK